MKRSTVVPGVGTSAILRIPLGQALPADRVALVSKRLLTPRSVEGVETAPLNRDEDEPEPKAAAILHDADVVDIAAESDNSGALTTRR